MKKFFNSYFFQTFQNYKKEYLLKDILAGLVVAALTIPVAMGYAQVAGIPPIYGLYASILPVIGYAILTRSPDLIVGLDATVSAITGSMLVIMGVTASSPEAINLAASMALMAGLFLCLFGFLKLGRFTVYLSRTVMTGFISGVALSILIGQIPKMLSLPANGTDFFANVMSLITNVSQINWMAAALAIVSVVVILVLKKVKPSIPGALIMLVVMTLASGLFKLDQYGVSVLGSIPQGLPNFFIPDLTVYDLSMMIALGFIMALIIFADSLLTVESFALKNKYKLNDSQELVAFGTSGILSAFSGTPIVAASVSRTAANDSAGGKTQATQLFSALFILIVVVFLSETLYYMPQAVLAGIVFTAVWGVIELKPGISIWRQKDYGELAVWLAAVLGVLLVGVIFGVVLAVLLSFADFVRKSAAPPQAFLGKIRGKDGFYDLHRHKSARPIPGVAIFRFSSALFFANAVQFSQSIIQLVEGEHPPKLLIFDMSGVSGIDHSAAEEIADMMKIVIGRKVKYVVVGAIGNVRDAIKTYGLDKYFPEEDMRRSISEALKERK